MNNSVMLRPVTIIALVALLAGLIVLLMLSGGSSASRIVESLLPMALLLVVVLFLALQLRDDKLDVMRALLRLEEGEAGTVLAKAQDRRAAGDTSPENTLILAGAHHYLGHGADAERLALKVLAVLQQDTPQAAPPGEHTRTLTGMAHITLFEARLAQGRFAAAAAGLRPHIPTIQQPNLAAALVVWGYFLAGQHTEARTLLDRLEQGTLLDAPPARDTIQTITPRYAFMLAYLQHVLHGTPFEVNFQMYHIELDNWQDEARRHAGNPYGGRLQTIVDDIRAEVEGDE